MLQIIKNYIGAFCLNRTNVELKQLSLTARSKTSRTRLNRTNVELKPLPFEQFVHKKAGLNRTNVELKRSENSCAPVSSAVVLIEPMWN